eukprot:TRINITY_DN33822_c0_g1_i1.p1 TRINITY_DN33822_c0_g1~~TRINITY_DN33822_c0_g1_i1.p1  ORF type:complete len:570 (+),score=75.44 TRINITY_DN33822_c0_g1_i1:119-1828(+)
MEGNSQPSPLTPPPPPLPLVDVVAEPVGRRARRRDVAEEEDGASHLPSSLASRSDSTFFRRREWLCQYGQRRESSQWTYSRYDWCGNGCSCCGWFKECEHDASLNNWQAARWHWRGGNEVPADSEELSWDGIESRHKSWRKPCVLFQLGSCWYGSSCSNLHVKVPPEIGLRTKLCEAFVREGHCSRTSCADAHDVHEMETPTIFKGMPGYKVCLCTYFMVPGRGCRDEHCFDAHGPLELRRPRLTVPRALGNGSFFFGDAHVHLDHVLLSRKYGSYFFYRTSFCKSASCTYGELCMFAHTKAARQYRSIDTSDFVSLVSEIDSLPGTFVGCVHSCCDADSIDLAVRLVEWGRDHFHGRVYAAFGIHPSNFEEFTPELQARLLMALEACGAQGVAWGECGLDYYRRGDDMKRDPTVRHRMREVFARQANLAIRRGLPLVVHSRDADADTLEILRKTVPPTHRVYLHSFMGSPTTVAEFLRRWPNSYVGIAGAISFTGGLQDAVSVLASVPIDRLLLETDGPYMAPWPHRGEESHPGHIPWIAEAVAKQKGIDTVEVLAFAHRNFCRFYGL